VHVSPVPQTVPSATLLQFVVLDDGWQFWQVLAEFGAPDA
jgi:hypothetical protein